MKFSRFMNSKKNSCRGNYMRKYVTYPKMIIHSRSHAITKMNIFLLGANCQQLTAMFRMINKVKPLLGAVRMRDLNSTSATKIQSMRTVGYYSTTELPSKISEQKTPLNNSKFLV